jgi:hypothetical protein
MKLSAFRAERLLPFACIIAAIVLFASETMTMFDLTPPGGETIQTQAAHDRHGNAIYVVAGFSILLTFAAIWLRSRSAALGVAVLGAVALLFFLIHDVPDAGRVGTIDDARASFFDAEAVPQAGFWLMLVGSLALAIGGAALATLSEAQLGALRPGSGNTTDADGSDDSVSPPKVSRNGHQDSPPSPAPAKKEPTAREGG